MNLVRDAAAADLRERVRMNAAEALHASGLTREQLSARAGISDRQLRRVLAGEKLGLDSLLPVADALGCDVSAFVAVR